MSLITGCAAVTGSDLRSSRLSLAEGALCDYLAPVFYGPPWHGVSETYLIDSTVVRSNERFGMPYLTGPMPRRQSAGLSQPVASASNGKSVFTSDPEEPLDAA